MVMYGAVLLMSVSESVQITAGICQFSRIFRSGSYCHQVLTNMFETFKNLQDASKTVHLKGRVPTSIRMSQKVALLGVTHKANLGVRWVHIIIRNETHRKSSPTPNKYRERWIFSNSPYSLHYVTILQGSINAFNTEQLYWSSLSLRITLKVLLRKALWKKEVSGDEFHIT